MKRRFLITAFIIAGTIFFASHAHASEGSLWIYMLLSPIIVMHSIPFSYTALCVIATIYCLWRYRVMRRKNFFAPAIGFIILTVLFATGETINYQEQERNRQRVEANSARIKAIYEGKQVLPMDANKLNAEMQKHIKLSGNPEVDRTNQEAAKELTNMAATLDKMNMQPVPPSAKMKTDATIVSTPDKIAWKELKDFYPAELKGQSLQEMEKIARERFKQNDLQPAAAIFLKTAQMAKTSQEKALYWSFAARCMAKKIDDSQPRTPDINKMSDLLKIPLSLANKALELSPNDEEVVYTAALLEYRSFDFGTAAATLKAADKRIKMGIPSLYLMEAVYGWANERAAERDASLRLGYDPTKTTDGWRPYNCNIWLATCEPSKPSEDSKRMNADGSLIMTREAMFGGFFLLFIVLIAGFVGWRMSFRVKGKSNARWIHSMTALGVAFSSIIIIGVIEASSASLFRNAFFSPWFQFIIMLPTLLLIAYVAGCFLEKVRTKYSRETSG